MNITGWFSALDWYSNHSGGATIGNISSEDPGTHLKFDNTIADTHYTVKTFVFDASRKWTGKKIFLHFHMEY